MRSEPRERVRGPQVSWASRLRAKRTGADDHHGRWHLLIPSTTDCLDRRHVQRDRSAVGVMDHSRRVVAVVVQILPAAAVAGGRQEMPGARLIEVAPELVLRVLEHLVIAQDLT